MVMSKEKWKQTNTYETQEVQTKAHWVVGDRVQKSVSGPISTKKKNTQLLFKITYCEEIWREASLALYF